MSDIKIETVITAGNLTIKTSGKLFKVVGLDGVGLPEMTLNELVDLKDCLVAMIKEVAKIDIGSV
jgi:hypothetical protein